MALISCPECGKEISDAAQACPHYGHPIQEPQPQDAPPASRKSKRPVIIAACVLALCLLVCSSCADSGPRHESYEDENGNFVIETDGRKTVSVSELPASVPYNDKSISLTSVAFYQNCTNYSYNLFTVITLDVSSLDDNEIYWLRNSDLDVDSYITCEANEYDFDSSYPLGNVLFTDSKELVFVEMSSIFKENRFGFEDSSVRVCVLVTQEDTYTSGSNSLVEINRKEEVAYTAMTGDSITDAEEIESPLYDNICKWLRSDADRFSQRNAS